MRELSIMNLKYKKKKRLGDGKSLATSVQQRAGDGMQKVALLQSIVLSQELKVKFTYKRHY